MGASTSRPPPPGAPPPPPAAPLRTFTDDELFAATAGFAARRQLGEGGFGRVFGGELMDGSRIAVKLLDRTGLQGEAEWRNEVDTLTRLPPHPSIVRLVGVCADGRVRGAVLAAVDGGSLRDALETSTSPLPWAARAGAAAGVAAALAHCHAAGVAHGDVASTNVLVPRQQATGIVCDFGLARPAAGPPADRVGNVAYAGPEAALPLPLPPAATAAAADVHALGVILCELLTGRAPHAARAAVVGAAGDWQSLVAVLDAALFADGGGPPAAAVAALAEAATGCMDADPANRPTAAAVSIYLAKAARAGGAPVRRRRAASPPPPPSAPPLLDFETSSSVGGATPRSRAALEAAVAAAPIVPPPPAWADGNPFA